MAEMDLSVEEGVGTGGQFVLK